MMGFVFDGYSEFHAVLILLLSCLFVVFCVFFLFCSVMALRFSCDGELSETLCTSRAADPYHERSKMCHQIFNSITSNIADCNYIDFYDNSLNFWNGNDSLILVHLNVRSLHKNFDDLHEFFSLLPFKPDVICLCESRINQPLKNIQLQGYNFLNAKPSKKAGGVAGYLSMKFNFTQLKSFQLYWTESIWLKIWNNNSAKTIPIGSINWHPTEDSNKFLDDFSDCMEKLADEKKMFTLLVILSLTTIKLIKIVLKLTDTCK